MLDSVVKLKVVPSGVVVVVVGVVVIGAGGAVGSGSVGGTGESGGLVPPDVAAWVALVEGLDVVVGAALTVKDREEALNSVRVKARVRFSPVGERERLLLLSY